MPCLCGDADGLLAGPALPHRKVLVDVSANLAEQGAARYGFDESSADWRSIVARRDIDVVDIVTPNDSHAEIAIAALAAGDKGGSGSKGKVDVDDEMITLLKVQSGAVGSIEATRNAYGRNNFPTFKAHGTRGSVAFDSERMDEIKVMFADDPADARLPHGPYRAEPPLRPGPAADPRARHRL